MTTTSDDHLGQPPPTAVPDAGPPDVRKPRSRPRSFQPLLLRLHFYAGVFVAPFILIAAITGALYALAPTLERLVYQDILTVDPGERALPLNSQAAAASAAAPGLTPAGMRPPASSTDSTRVYFSDTTLPEDTQRAVFVDPYTGQTLGSENVWFGYLPLSTWLDGLHRHLQLGEPGRIYSELAASWLWVIALGGLYLWVAKLRKDRRRRRPGRLLAVDRGTAGRARTLSWHGATGVWILLALLFLSATGITWSTYAGAHVSDIRAQFNWQRPGLNTTVVGDARSPVNLEDVNLDEVVAVAGRSGVHAPLDIAFPTEPGEAIGVTETDKAFRATTNAVAINPDTLVPSSELDFRRDYSLVAKLADWGIRAHMGVLFGLLNQLLLLAVALALITVIIRGYRMWWQRRPTRGTDWMLGRPPLRGGIRHLSPLTVIVVAAGAIAIGWFLPLLGLSLLAFLLVDTGVAAAKAWRAP